MPIFANRCAAYLLTANRIVGDKLVFNSSSSWVYSCGNAFAAIKTAISSSVLHFICIILQACQAPQLVHAALPNLLCSLRSNKLG